MDMNEKENGERKRRFLGDLTKATLAEALKAPMPSGLRAVNIS
jgi:hypothetical protein